MRDGNAGKGRSKERRRPYYIVEGVRLVKSHSTCGSNLFIIFLLMRSDEHIHLNSWYGHCESWNSSPAGHKTVWLDFNW